MVQTRNTANQAVQERLSDGEDFDIVGSEEYDSEDHYPTKISKKRDVQKLDNAKKPVNKKARAVQKHLNSKDSHRTHRTAKLNKSASEAPAIKIICVACNNAHSKCGKSDVPGQPCERCARMGIRCVVDPNHKRDRGHGGANLGKMGTDKKRIASQTSKKEEVGDDSSEDPLTSLAPTNRSISRNTTNHSAKYSTRARSRSAKPHHGNDYSSSSSPLSSAPDDSEDELDTTMADMKEQQTKKTIAVSLTPKPCVEASTTRSAARKGLTHGVPLLAGHDNNTKQDDHHVPSSVTGPMPQQRIYLDDSSVLPDNATVSDQGQDQCIDEKESCDNTAVNSPGSVSDYRVAFAPPDTVPEDQPAKQITVADLHTTHNTPTFLPKGHGSVLNSDTDDTGAHTILEQHHQQTSPLPPISHLGAGGAYIGRYDTSFPVSTASTSGPEPEVAIMTSSRIVSAPTTSTNDHSVRSTQASPDPSPRSFSSPNYMPPEGSPAYRYSATKILFLLKHAHRAQLLALGGAHIAPDAIAKLTNEIEDTRTRAMSLWHEVHDDVALSEEMYDEGGLRFLQDFGCS